MSRMNITISIPTTIWLAYVKRNPSNSKKAIEDALVSALSEEERRWVFRLEMQQQEELE